MRRCLSLLAALSLGIAVPIPAAAQIDAKESFESRQRDLVRLSGQLGKLHRLHQICGPGYYPDQYRDRMRQLVPLESPMGSTRLDMIEAFNSGFREASRLYLSCGGDTRYAYEQSAQDALVVVDRLYAPFR